MVPLAADLARSSAPLRLKPSTTATVVELDLRRDAQLARSVLLHRLALLGIDWGERVDTGRTTGTFKEAWQLEWYPSSPWLYRGEPLRHHRHLGDRGRGRRAGRAGGDLAALGRLVEQVPLGRPAGRPGPSWRRCRGSPARQHDTVALLGTVEPLARTCRYGDVRGVDVGGR